MSNLTVRNLDETIVKALKKQAGLHGNSAEAEHRIILKNALEQPNKKTFSEMLAAMPNVGKDSDFARQQ